MSDGHAADPGRLVELDAIRGLAVMGILLINITSFAMPWPAYVDPTSWGGTGPADMASWTISQLLFEGRMRGLFALLFGVSAMLVIERGDAVGGNGNAVHLRRMAALAPIGLAHLALMWDGDVLFHYALVGSLIPLLRRAPPYKLMALAATIVLVSTFAWSLSLGAALRLELAAQAPGAAPALVADAQAMLRAFPTTASPENVALMRGDYAGILLDRLSHLSNNVTQLTLALGGETLGYMLVGMALWKSGFFTGGWSDGQIRRLMIRCYAVSLPVLALLTGWAFISKFDPIVLMGNFIAWSVPFRLACAVGHLALATLLVRRFERSGAVARLAAVGRMALSNYLATSIVMTTIFYGYGLGLFGWIDRTPLNLFVVGMWAAMLLWSLPWLARFRFGPAEWLWRSLARGAAQPLSGGAR